MSIRKTAKELRGLTENLEASGFDNGQAQYTIEAIAVSIERFAATLGVLAREFAKQNEALDTRVTRQFTQFGEEIDRRFTEQTKEVECRFAMQNERCDCRMAKQQEAWNLRFAEQEFGNESPVHRTTGRNRIHRLAPVCPGLESDDHDAWIAGSQLRVAGSLIDFVPASLPESIVVRIASRRSGADEFGGATA